MRDHAANPANAWEEGGGTISEEKHVGRVIFVSGWGLASSLWTPVQAALMRISEPGLTCTTLELGATTPSFLPATFPCLAVGHSTGFLWLLRARPVVWDGLVAVNGFTRFIAGFDFPQGVRTHLLERMLRRFNEDPAAVTVAFLHRCGMREIIMPTLQQPDHLQQGLVWLRDWDTRSAFAAESVPRLVLAGSADQIVSPAMTEACFGGQNGVEIIWQSGGEHLLPLSHPLWLAEHLQVFVQQLRRDQPSPSPSILVEAR